MSVIQVFVSMLLAAIPALIWFYVFSKRQPEEKNLSIYMFALGSLAVFPILIYKYLWQYMPWINAFQYVAKFDDTIVNVNSIFSLPIGILFSFLIVGVIEELMKHYCVRAINFRFFRSIDDVIEFSIIAALGFSFTENILYFSNIWGTKGIGELVQPFLFRSVFSTFAHVMFSGIFGYYYGVGLFANTDLKAKMLAERTLFGKFLAKVFKFKTRAIFYEENLLKGFMIAAVLHAIFNVLLHLDFTFLTVPYLVGGYIIISYLFDKKENQQQSNLLNSQTRRSNKGLLNSSLKPLAK